MEKCLNTKCKGFKEGIKGNCRDAENGCFDYVGIAECAYFFSKETPVPLKSEEER